ncbi:MAG: S-methyl-5-thioribose-1-phosphate isomerase [Planctomycetes bacterium]|nr:S-methyl-5-thioribose-1-phosphate isomerase [Planctomycetota bacterium]
MAGFETLAWRGDLPGALEIIDQRALPARHDLLRLETVPAAWDAIKTLAVRGAPAIGVAAAYGVVLGAQEALARGGGGDGVAQAALAAADHLATSRPTAVNLFWALERMRRALGRLVDRGVAGDGAFVARSLLAEARAIHEEDRATCRAIGRHGAALLGRGARVLTHCNAGGLATSDYGTALGCIYAAVEGGNPVTVLSCETRPLLQGARLTSWELERRGIPVTLISDGMSGFAMQRGRVDAVIVGADRIARNGDVANKIGTYGHAVLAREHGIPFYVAAPVSTFDLSLASGAEIPIEERAPDEVTTFGGQRVAPEGVDVWNPAFDVTPARLVTAIICERGVIQPVDEEHVMALAGAGGWCR